MKVEGGWDEPVEGDATREGTMEQVMIQIYNVMIIATILWE